jgi:hypothetical protein
VTNTSDIPDDIRCDRDVTVELDGEATLKAMSKQLEELKYSNLRWLDNMGICGTFRFIFTVGVVYGIDETGYIGRFCFDTEQNARLFLKYWNGLTRPIVGVDGCKAIK